MSSKMFWRAKNSQRETVQIDASFVISGTTGEVVSQGLNTAVSASRSGAGLYQVNLGSSFPSLSSWAFGNACTVANGIRFQLASGSSTVQGSATASGYIVIRALSGSLGTAANVNTSAIAPITCSLSLVLKNGVK